MQFVQARNYYRGRRKSVRLIVIHTMETPQKPGTALSVARWFAGPDAPIASAHYCFDDAETVQCVREEDTAWHAPGVNSESVGFEHSGSAALRHAGWVDRYSQLVLTRSARQAAITAARHRIPLVHLTNEQLAAGAPGFVGHIQVTEVYKQGDHTDPGPEYPWDAYLKLVQAAAAANAKTPWTKQHAAVAAAALGVPVAWFAGVQLLGSPAPAPAPRPAVTVTVTATPHPTRTPTPARRPTPTRLPIHTLATKAPHHA